MTLFFAQLLNNFKIKKKILNIQFKDSDLILNERRLK